MINNRAAFFATVFLAGLATCASAAGPDILQEWNSVQIPPPPKINTVTVDPKTTAVLSLDFNARTCTPQGRARCAAMIPNVVKLLTEARTKGMLVIHAATSNMKNEDIHKEVAPKGDEKIIRGRGDKFMGSNLDQMLKERGIKTVIVMGTSGSSAVLYTALGAAQRDYKAIVPIDTMPADTAFQEQFAIWLIANGSQLREGATLSRSDMIKF